MPICSYIVHPRADQKRHLTDRLNSIEGCTAHPSDNKDLIVLVTETENPRADEALRDTLTTIDDIECLALTYANFEEDIHETA